MYHVSLAVQCIYGWKEYFVKLLNGDEVRDVEGDIRRESFGENERVVRGG